MDAAEIFKAFEADGWSDRAETYDRLTGAITERFFDDLLDGAGIGPGSRSLDVACGPGHLAARAAGRGAEASGVDISPGMVELARRNHPGIQFAVADAEDLPFAEASHDAVTAAFVVNHLPQPDRALCEVARVLVPGGRAAVAVWERPDCCPFFGLVDDALRRAAVSLPPDAVPAGPDQYRFGDERLLAALLADAGFEDVAVHEAHAVHAVADPFEAWEGLLGGSVRLAARVAALPAPERDRLRAAFGEVLEDEGLELLAIAKLAAGVRP